MKRFAISAFLFIVMALPASAEIIITDAYARVATPMAKSGAAFLTIMNRGEAGDHLISVESQAAKRVELHRHSVVDGVMQMRHVEDGIEIPAGGSHRLERGGDHIMFMGLSARWQDGDAVPVLFHFEKAGEVAAEIVVDSKRQPEPDAASGHTGHSGSD